MVSDNFGWGQCCPYRTMSVNDKQVILFDITIVLIADAVEKYHLVKAVLNSDSQTSAITSTCAQMLGLRI